MIHTRKAAALPAAATVDEIASAGGETTLAGAREPLTKTSWEVRAATPFTRWGQGMAIAANTFLC